ncbi:MAG TPA: class I SAM-dependent methyltransferase [Solirubrobacteraceae bacterium]
MSKLRDPPGRASEQLADRDAVVWHELECGGYRADLPLWHELAAAAAPDGPILDVGAGSGRVALDLARAGHEVTALDLDERLLRALAGRIGSLPLQTVNADARSFELARRDYALCIAPMQTVQLLGGTDGRIAFLRCARRHLRRGGLLACAILGELEPFDCRDGGPAPAPERTRVDGRLYLSQALRVELTRRSVVLERERTVAGGTAARAPERDVIELDRLTATRLRREGREAGLSPLPTRSVSATDQHVASSVVVLRA